MAEGVVQQEEGASAQHFACAPDESAGNQMIAEDRLVVPIHVRSAGGGLPGCDAPTGQSLEVQAASASVSVSSPPERASLREKPLRPAMSAQTQLCPWPNTLIMKIL
jgi:hypothetical protein